MVLGAEDAHLELGHGDEAIVLPLFEVDELNRWALGTCLAVLANTRAFQQQIENVSVVLNEVGARKACRKLLDHLLDLVIFKPTVDDLELLPQDRQHDDFRKILAKRLARLLLAVAINDFPS